MSTLSARMLNCSTHCLGNVHIWRHPPKNLKSPSRAHAHSLVAPGAAHNPELSLAAAPEAAGTGIGSGLEESA